MDYFIDVSYDHLNKNGEELCGDNVEIIKNEDNVIIVLSDGLGSGVKANILAILTTKIASTMLREGATIDETVKTISHTLPVCKIRKLAYSTFTIIKIKNDGNVYIAEYDNPPYFLIKDRKIYNTDKISINIENKVIKESNFKLCEGDLLTIVSDGVIHAGVGGILNLGWQWENVAKYLETHSENKKSSKNVSKELVGVCNNLYLDKPGDDTTVVAVKVRKPEVIDLFTGPPKDDTRDSEVVKNLMKAEGKKIVCGGTAAKIVSRELGVDLEVNIDSMVEDVPPTATIEGIDLVTEGVLTLSKTVVKIKKFIDPSTNIIQNEFFNNRDGSSMLVDNLINNCTHLNLWVGKAINPAHQNPDLPIDLSIKLKVVEELVQSMEYLGKKVEIHYI